MSKTEVFDYLKTDEAIFIQRATFSPDGSIIGLPILIKDKQGDRMVDGERYRKMEVNNNSFPLLNLAVQRVDLGGDVYQLSKSNVTKVFRHRGLELVGEKRRIADTIAEIVGHNVSMIGSSLLGSEEHFSDWDILVYGASAPVAVRQHWSEILEALKADETSADKIENKVRCYSRRFDIGVDLLERILQRRNAKFYIGGKEGSIMFTYSPEDQIPQHPFKTINGAEEVTLVDRVVDNKHSLMMPRMYECEGCRVWSFRWLDRGFAVTGEKVKICGYKLSDRDVLLSTNSHYIIPLELLN
jgi:predicted nucleotidyltransferase